MVDHIDQSAPSFDRSTTRACGRTRLAYQRTMLSWVRTATSLITFGFAVYNIPSHSDWRPTEQPPVRTARVRADHNRHRTGRAVAVYDRILARHSPTQHAVPRNSLVTAARSRGAVLLGARHCGVGCDNISAMTIPIMTSLLSLPSQHRGRQLAAHNRRRDRRNAARS